MRRRAGRGHARRPAPSASAPELVAQLTGALLCGAQGLHDRGQSEIAESAAFRDWMLARSTERDWDALFDYRAQAPHAADMHPSDEHLLPWYVAAGTGGREATPRRLHASVTFGALGMDTYAFGSAAAALEAALRALPEGPPAGSAPAT